MTRLRCALVCLCLVLTSAAFAETPTFDPDSYEAFDDRAFTLPAAAEIPPAAMAEMQEAYATCTGLSFYDRTHDCGCAAMMFLEARIADPDAAVFTLRKDAQEACIDPNLVEAIIVQRCLNNPRIQGTDEERATQCNCVGAETMAAYLAAVETPKSSDFRRMRSEANRMCIKR